MPTHQPRRNTHKVNFIEKMLATVLAKLSNFVPEAGIWLNTQRPEWNDANNALVGNGVSMVTLYYLRRFLAFSMKTSNKTKTLRMLFQKKCLPFEGIKSTFENNANLIDAQITDQQRKSVMDALGEVATTYRETIYSHGFSGDKAEISHEQLVDFIASAQRFRRCDTQKQKRRWPISCL